MGSNKKKSQANQFRETIYIYISVLIQNVNLKEACPK